MKRGNTKEEILDAALALYSAKGFEASSISEIAAAVGIRKASLYSHFANKQDILDTLMIRYVEEFGQHSIFAGAGEDGPAFTADKVEMTKEDIAAMVKGQVDYILHDPKIRQTRRMLTIEQFQNPKLRALHSKVSYENILKYNCGLMRSLIGRGLLQNDDPEIMAAQFAWPISIWICQCDREPEREGEVMELIDRHIEQFFRRYGRN